MPAILSSEFDTYEGYEVARPAPYDIYQAHHSQAHDLHASTPPPPAAISRSPDATLRSTVSYTSASSVSGSLAPRIKMEHGVDYSQGLGVSRYPSPRSVHTAYATESGPYADSASGYLSDGQSSWRTTDYLPSMDPDHYYGGTATPSPLIQDVRRGYRVPRARRAPRRLTTREEANFQCEVKGCGKLFSRSYNFKAHMETHDEKREYPFPCMAEDCSKKFVRKTDLQRHHQSVHMKERNHKCDYCGRLFARKDTLRRHMEDGCSKRFDIGTLDLRSENYETSHGNGRHHGITPLNLLGPPPSALPAISMSSLGSSSGIVTSTTTPIRSTELLGSQPQEHSWDR